MTLPTADSPYGEWSEDDAGLPCFDLDPEARADPDAPLEHLLSTGVMTALVNRWGDLRLMTCAGGEGQKALRPSRWMCASDLLVNAVVDGELHSLLPGQLDKGRRARWGTGYARFHGTLKRTGFAAEFTQELIAPWDDSAGIHGRFAVRNLGQRPIELTLRVCAQVAAVPEAGSVDPLVEGGEGWVRAAAAHPSLGDVILVGPDGWAPSREHVSLVLSRACRLEAGEEVRFHAWLGCTPGGTSADIGLLRDQARSLEPARERMEWAERLAPVSMPAPASWITRECVWTAGQLLAFTGYDGARRHSFTLQGGYCWYGATPRECAETAMALAAWSPSVARESFLWLASNQWPSGDMPKAYGLDGRLQRPPGPVESDNEIWFLLAIGETLAAGLPETILDLRVPFADGTDASLWEHVHAAWHWVRDAVGVGSHGLLKIWHGDWDDYMSAIGRQGKGESTMNTGMAVRALDHLFRIARQRGDADLAAEMGVRAASLRAAMMNAFDGTHFVRGYTDAGRPVGTREEDRVHLNAQSWAALGGFGTPAMRRTALQTVLRECDSPIGLTLMSRPYPSPPPADISWCPIAPGEGENAGIWPQTVHWTVWALAEAGMVDEAEKVWVAVSLHNHAARHPDVPYGIWNASDCFSSRHAGSREGRTQVQMLDRMREGIPMNPSIAWQAFSWAKILRHRGDHDKGS